MIPANFRPNLAATLTKPELIKFPVWASPKIDGIRCTVFGGVAYSRSLKPIPNLYVQEWAAGNYKMLEGLDGELVVGSATYANCMQNSMAVMRRAGEPDFTFFVFDYVDRFNQGFDVRYLNLQDDFGPDYPIPGRVSLLLQSLSANIESLDKLEAEYLEHGYEGMMIRSPDAPYKFGRSTEREGGLVKVKRFTDAEAEVIGFEEEMHNGNESRRDNLGRAERSSVSSGLIGKQTLGALRCRTPEGIEFNIGTGFTAEQRAEYWQTVKASELLGAVVKYKYFCHGIKESPRHPVFLGFRHKDDMS